MNSNSGKVVKKGKISFWIGNYDLQSIRETLNPKIQFNVKSIILIISGIVTLSFLNLISNNYLINSIFMLILLDFLILAIIMKPVRYIKHGYIVNSRKDLNFLIINKEITFRDVKWFITFLIPRIVIYIILIYLFSDFFDPSVNENINNYFSVILLTLFLVSSLLLLSFIVTIVFIGIGLIIEDYLQEGTTFTAVKDLRNELASQAPELDKIIEWLNEPKNARYGNKSVTNQYRRKAANSLYKLRNYLAKDEDNPEEEPVASQQDIAYVQAEINLSNELLLSLKQDKCVVCYASLDNAKGELLACPICGQGGHKDHLDSWFATGKSECPTCKSNVEINNYLLFNEN